MSIIIKFPAGLATGYAADGVQHNEPPRSNINF